MNDERMKHIKNYAQVRLHTGDILAAYLLELMISYSEAQEEITRLRRHLGEIP